MADVGRRVATAVLALSAAGAASACRPDDRGGSGPGDEGALATFSGAVSEAATTYLVQNAEAFNSVEFFVPFIGRISAAPSAADGAPAWASPALESCLPAEELGVTFDFNEETNEYEPTSLARALADGLRVLLYRVQSGLLVTPKEQLGHLDLSCSTDLPSMSLGVSLVANDVEILRIDATGTVSLLTRHVNLQLPIVLHAPSGAAGLAMGGWFVGTLASNTSAVVVPVANTMLGTYARTASETATSAFVSASGAGHQPDADWSFALHADVTSGSIVGPEGGPAPATFADRNGGVVVACFTGSEHSPVVSDATTARCPFPDHPPVSLSPQELRKLRTAYGALLSFHGVASRLWGVTLELSIR